MYISGATSKKDVDKWIKSSNSKSKTSTYSAKLVTTKIGKMWKVTVKRKTKTAKK